MPALIGNGVTLRGLRSEDFTYTWVLTGTGGVAPEIGAAMTQDLTANNSAKTSDDGLTILGALMSYENRVQEGITVGAIAHKGNFTWKYTGTAPVRGNSVVGSATRGSVKDSGNASTGVTNRVVEVDTVNSLVTVMFG